MRQSRSTGSAGKNQPTRPSLETNSSDEDGPQPTSTNASGLGMTATPIHRLERKRHQEKRRRHEFKDALNSLQDTLLKHDDDFLRKSKERQQRRSEMGTIVKEDKTLFNRVELVNQAIFTIREFCHQNDMLKTVIADLKAGRDTPTPASTAPYNKLSIVSLLPTQGRAAAYARPPTFHWESGPPLSINDIETSVVDPKTARHGTRWHRGKPQADLNYSEESRVLPPSTLFDHSAVTPVMPYVAQSQILAQMQQQLHNQGIPTMASLQFPTSQLHAHIGPARALQLPPPPLRDALNWGLPRGSSRLLGHNNNELLELLPSVSRGGRESSLLLPQSTHAASLTAQRPDVGRLSSSFTDNATTFQDDE